VLVHRRSDDKWLLFAQTKYAIGVRFAGANTMAPIGGYIEVAAAAGQSAAGSGEAVAVALAAAQRELKEECGYAADGPDWVLLHSGVADANRGAGVGHLFVALNAYDVGRAYGWRTAPAPRRAHLR
jgi:8-oxo-dGTP pyrophosphatase MutT (NUDIX family)